MTTLVFILAFCVVAVLVYMARYSGRLHATCTRVIAAPIDEVYARVADFRRWGTWNPWLEHDPGASVTLTGKPDSAGGCYAWNDERSGAGQIEHLRLVARERIEQRMNFEHPFRFRGRGRWQFVDRAGSTEVSWTFKGRVSFSLRAFAQTVQGMIALDFRYGLDRLAGLVERADAARYSIGYLGIREIPAMRYVYTTYNGSLSGLPAAMDKGFAELRDQLARLGVVPAGAPMAAYTRTNVKLRTTVCLIGIPVGAADCGPLAVRELAAHRAYVACLQGSYSALEVAWYQAMQRMRIENIQPDPRIPPFERYLNDPAHVAENDRLTELHVPIR